MEYVVRQDPVAVEYMETCRKWIRKLQALRTENASLINSLATALKGTVCRSFVDEAERFQLKILDREEILVLLRHEVIEQLEWLEKQSQERPSPYSYVALKRDVEKMMMECENVRKAFLIFLTAVKPDLS